MSSVIIPLTQQHKCSNSHLFLIYATYFGHHQAILQNYKRQKLMKLKKRPP